MDLTLLTAANALRNIIWLDQWWSYNLTQVFHLTSMLCPIWVRDRLYCSTIVCVDMKAFMDAI